MEDLLKTNNTSYSIAIAALIIVIIVIILCSSSGVLALYIFDKNANVEIITNSETSCPPLYAENDAVCKNNMDWLQANWDPSWAVNGVMKENNRCYAYKKAKSEFICK